MGSKTVSLIILAAVIVLWGSSLSHLLAQADPLHPEGTIIVVNTELDSLDDDGLCSLREAVQAANTDSAVYDCAAGQGADTIVLASGTYTMTISGADEEAAATGDLDITDDVEIKGNGSSLTVVSGNGIDRVFHVDPTEKGIHVEFLDLAIQDGDAIRDVVDVDIKGGGGILTHSEIVLNGVKISNNRAHRGGGLRITSLGSAIITDAVFEDNFADREGGGIYGDGSMDLQNVQIINNEADRGGGVFCDRICDFLDVSISFNEAPRGGGIYSDHILNLTNVTIDHNGKNNGVGGGIFNQAEILLINTTLSSNIAAQGSGLYSEDIAYLQNVTFYQNWSNVSGPGLVNALGATFELVNTIIANEYGQPNCQGDFTSLGHNLSGDNSCDFVHATDIPESGIQLDALNDNGGYTQTHALQFGSEAVDAGDDQKCPGFDQRYYSRPADGDHDDIARCDIGAYELTPGGVIQFNPQNYSVEESDGAVQIAVDRAEGVSGEISVDYVTWAEYGPGKAYRNIDYINTYGTLTWVDGDNSAKYISVFIVDDPYYELDETFSVILQNVTGSAGISEVHRIATVTILENDEGGPPEPPAPEPYWVFMPIIEK